MCHQSNAMASLCKQNSSKDSRLYRSSLDIMVKQFQESSRTFVASVLWSVLGSQSGVRKTLEQCPFQVAQLVMVSFRQPGWSLHLSR